MPRNDDGEFELVLGNRQLLSVFFLVIVLLGLFFTMGLIMGRSSGINTVAEMKKVDNAPTSNPIVVDDGGTRPSAAAAVVPKETPKADPPARTEPERKKEAEVKTEAKKEPEPKKEEPKRAEVKKPEPPPAPAGGAPPPGTYWQVAAVKRQEAEIVSSLVGKRGYRVYLVPLKEGSDTLRVLVGPAANKEQQNKMAEDLRAEGFKPFPRRL